MMGAAHEEVPSCAVASNVRMSEIVCILARCSARPLDVLAAGLAISSPLKSCGDSCNNPQRPKTTYYSKGWLVNIHHGIACTTY
jgi:hypothetical protein